MNEDEVYKLLERVRVYYQHLSRSDDLLDEWYKILKDYSANEVENTLNEYLSIEKNRSRIPMPQDLTQGLLTIQQKKKKFNSNYSVRCNLCGKEMPLAHYNSHYDKCLSIMYLISVFKQQGENVDYKTFATLDDKKFNAIYEKYKNY